MRDEVWFPFDPALAGTEQLDAVPIMHTETVREQLIEEGYSVDATGLVEVRIANVGAGYSRVYKLGRWAERPAPVLPSRRRRHAAK